MDKEKIDVTEGKLSPRESFSSRSHQNKVEEYLDLMRTGQIFEEEFFTRLKCSSRRRLGGFISSSGFQKPIPQFEKILKSPLPDETNIEEITTKWFRNLDMLPIESLPTSYPKASKRSWNDFWHSSIPHAAKTILWRLYHSKFPSRSRLHHIMPNTVTDQECLFCGAIETDEHFLWSCPIKRPIWNTLAHRFLEQPSLLSYSFLNRPLKTKAKTLAQWNLDPIHVVACGVLSLWRLHWQYTFDNKPFWPNEVTARATLHLKQIHSENQYKSKMKILNQPPNETTH